MLKYRFLEKDEFGNPCHRHQLFIKDEWVDITGGSSIVGILDKPLAFWASGLAVKTFSGIEDCKVLTKIKNGKATEEEIVKTQNTINDWIVSHLPFTSEKHLKLCIEAYFAHTVRLAFSAEAGTELHGELESYIKACIYNNDSKPIEIKEDRNQYIIDFSEFACKYIKKFLWSEAHMYDEDLFVGGISDAGVEMNDGSFAIIDFKSAKEAYFSHFIQAAIYDLLIEKNGLVNEKGESLNIKIEKPISKYLIIPFGAKEFTVHENDNVKGLKEAALSCIKIYREKSYFDGK